MYDFSKDLRPKIKTSEIVIKPDRARKDFAGMMDLLQSIKENGLAHPVVLTMESGKPTLVAGESRLKCYMLLPETGGMIPFTMREEMSPMDQKILELEENTKRQDLSWLEQISNREQIDTLKRLIVGDQTIQNPDGWSHKKTAEFTGISPGFATQQINMAKLMKSRPDIKERVKNLPLKAAISEAARIQESEDTERKHSNGLIQLTSDLHHCDAVDFLCGLNDSSIDLFLTDPPFGMESIEDRRDTDSPDSQNYTSKLKDSDNSTPDKVIDLLSRVIPQMFRTLKPGRHFYMFFELELLGPLSKLLVDSGLIIQWPILIWDKGRTTVPFRGYNYQSCYEAIFYGYKPDSASASPRRLAEASASIIKVPALHASKKIHPFEKPLDLLSGFIRRSTNHGDLVCDPFSASASTLVASRQTGRRGCGCELDRETFLKAQARLLMESALANATATPRVNKPTK